MMDSMKTGLLGKGIETSLKWMILGRIEHR
jgi:hypothetical protein